MFLTHDQAHQAHEHLKLLLRPFVFFLLLLTPIVAWAQDAINDLPDTDAEVVLGFVETIIEAAQQGEWAVLASGVIMVIIWVIRRFFWSSLPKEWVPSITVLLGYVSVAAGAIMMGAGVGESLMAGFGGLLVGLASVGFWELLGKRFLGKPEADESPQG